MNARNIPKIMSKELNLTSGWFLWAQVAAVLTLLIGAQLFAMNVLHYNLMEELFLSALFCFEQAYALGGWTVLFFFPVLSAGMWLLFSRISNMAFPGFLLKWLCMVDARDLHVGIGLLGTLWGFMEVARNSGQTGSPSEALTSILIGMGSTFLGVITSLFLKIVIPETESDRETA